MESVTRCEVVHPAYARHAMKMNEICLIVSFVFNKTILNIFKGKDLVQNGKGPLLTN